MRHVLMHIYAEHSLNPYCCEDMHNYVIPSITRMNIHVHVCIHVCKSLLTKTLYHILMHIHVHVAHSLNPYVYHYDEGLHHVFLCIGLRGMLHMHWH